MKFKTGDILYQFIGENAYLYLVVGDSSHSEHPLDVYYKVEHELGIGRLNQMYADEYMVKIGEL